MSAEEKTKKAPTKATKKATVAKLTKVTLLCKYKGYSFGEEVSLSKDELEEVKGYYK